MMRPVSYLVGLGLAGMLYGAGTPPPPDARTFPHGGRAYGSGCVYLDTHADTAGLLPWGFQNFVFDGRVPRAVRYRAAWPLDVPIDSLPAALSGMEWDRDAEAAAPSDGELADLAPGWHWRSGGRTMAFSTSHPFPKNNWPDTVIAGDPFVRGTAILFVPRDTVKLKALGFRNFRMELDPLSEQFPSALDDGYALWTVHCLWPLSFPFEKLPPEIVELTCERAKGAQKYTRRLRLPQ